MRSTCRRCSGKGVSNKHPCKECGGGGQTKQQHRVRVPVPAGIEDGQTVRMSVGSKEIFITFQVAPSDYFRRMGSDVHTDAKISLAQAALGGAVRVQVKSVILFSIWIFVPSSNKCAKSVRPEISYYSPQLFFSKCLKFATNRPLHWPKSSKYQIFKKKKLSKLLHT